TGRNEPAPSEGRLKVGAAGDVFSQVTHREVALVRGLLEDRDSLVAVHRFCVMMMPTARSIRAGGHRGAAVLLGLMMAGQASRAAVWSTPFGHRTLDGTSTPY